MGFSRYILTTGIFILALSITALGLGIFLQNPEFPFTASLFIILLVAETAALFIYLGKIRRDLLRLITALRNEDPSLQFRKDSKDPYFSEIHKGFNEIISNFRLIRADKEVEHQFFKATVDHVQFGIAAFRNDGEIEMVNKAFLKLFGIAEISNIAFLSSTSSGLPEFLSGLENNQEALRKFQIGTRFYHLIFLASKFKLKQTEITLVSIRDISREIDKNELEAWQKLLRILRHEILNSLSPVKLISSSLMETIHSDGKNKSLRRLSNSEVETLHTGLRSIHNRASGLSDFLEAYSNLYQIPEPKFESVKVSTLLNKISLLHKDQFEKEEIAHSVDVPSEELTIEIDSRLIEHVLINLIKNAVEAIEKNKNKIIHFSSKIIGNEIIISISDNGPGIPEDQLESIFIPFYSTKEKGSGIGLSFSQHVMRLHNGHLNVFSNPESGTEFQLVFR